MADKLSKIEKRLRSARFADHQIDPFSQVVARLPEDWIDTSGFDLAAGLALRVQVPSPEFAPLVRLFKIADLSHEIPWHWPLLLGLIAWCISQENKGPGAPPKWTNKKMNELRADLATLKSSGNDSRAAEHLIKRFPAKYRRLNVRYFRKVIARSRKEAIPETVLSAQTKQENVSRRQVVDELVALIKQEIANESALMKFVDAGLGEKVQ